MKDGNHASSKHKLTFWHNSLVLGGLSPLGKNRKINYKPVNFLLYTGNWLFVRQFFLL